MTADVRKRCSAVEEAAQEWPMLDALLGGTRAMRQAGKHLLPQWPNEEQKSYDQRLATATLFPAYQRTVDVLSAKPFSKPVTLGESVPTRLQEWAEDIDLQGRSLHAFSADIVELALSHGLCGILVEYPQAQGIRTQADEASAGVRPYWVQIHPNQLLGWKAGRVGGAWQFTQLRLLERVIVEDGEFSERTIEQVRVLTPGGYQLWRENAEISNWYLFEEGVTTLPVIPFVPVYGQRDGFMRWRPPLLDLAYQNVKHWQSQSDQDTILHVARVPILFAKGLPDEVQITVGASSAIKSSSPDADLKFVEHSGQAIGAGKDSLLALEDQMRQTGAELLVIKPGGMSDTQTLADNESGRCALQRLVEDAEDAIEQAMWLTAQWVGEATGGDVEIFDDFGAATLAEASADLLLKANTAGKISDETLFEEYKRRSLISSERTWADEQERISGQGPALGAIPPGGPGDA